MRKEKTGEKSRRVRGQASRRGREEKLFCAVGSGEGMKVIIFALRDLGIFMGHYSRNGLFNVICRKHTLFASSA